MSDRTKRLFVICRVCEKPIDLLEPADTDLSNWPQRFVARCTECHAQGLYKKSEVISPQNDQ